jgi:hypothetical protein
MTCWCFLIIQGKVSRRGGSEPLNHVDDYGETVVLDNTGKATFQRCLNSGGNFIAIYASSDCLVNATFYSREVGTYLPAFTKEAQKHHTSKALALTVILLSRMRYALLVWAG